jgi:hypothetical protein
MPKPNCKRAYLVPRGGLLRAQVRCHVLTEPNAHDPNVKRALGLEPSDEMVGVLYVGLIGVMPEQLPVEDLMAKCRQMDGRGLPYKCRILGPAASSRAEQSLDASTEASAPLWVV